MNAGFIGTGVITEAIVKGLLAADYPLDRILVSARSRDVSGRLSSLSGKVHVMENNQHIIDRSEIIFLAVRPQIAERVLKLLHFPDNKEIVSVIATLPIERIRDWIGGSATITRAIPLPAVAENRGVTVIYPPCPILESMCSSLGTVVVAEHIEAFNRYGVASALMGQFFGTLETLAQWISNEGAQYQAARFYLSTLYQELVETSVRAADTTFDDLRIAHSTPGGINEQLFKEFSENGGLDALRKALDVVSHRVEQPF